MVSGGAKEAVYGGLTEAMGSHHPQWDGTFLWCSCFGRTHVPVRNLTRLCKDARQSHWFSKLNFGELYLVCPHLFVSPEDRVHPTRSTSHSFCLYLWWGNNSEAKEKYGCPSPIHSAENGLGCCEEEGSQFYWEARWAETHEISNFHLFLGSPS